MRRLWMVAPLVIGLGVHAARAEVVESAPSGFAVRTTARIARPAGVVYDALVGRVADWWNAEHTWSGDARNLSIEARPGGCFCERLPGGGVLHMNVLLADRGKTLRLSGGLGPLQGMAVTGTWTLEFAEAGGATTVTSTYVVGGHARNGFAMIAPAVDQVIAEQVQRLKAFAER